MKQLDLDGEVSLKQPKPKKRKGKIKLPKRERKTPQAWAGAFTGTLVPLPSLDAHHITCACGRIQLYRTRTNMLFFYDKEGPLGDSTLRARKTLGGYTEGARIYFAGDEQGLARAVTWLQIKNCQLHEGLERHRDAHLERFEPAPAFRLSPYR